MDMSSVILSSYSSPDEGKGHTSDIETLVSSLGGSDGRSRSMWWRLPASPSLGGGVIPITSRQKTPERVSRVGGIAWWGINIYWVCGNTMCVSTCQVEFVLRELSFFILLPQSRFIGCSVDFSVLKRTVQLFNYHPGGRYRKLAGTTTLAYRIVINCTTTESVLELVSTSWVAWSIHRQETSGERLVGFETLHGGSTMWKGFVVTPCNDYLWMSWGWFWKEPLVSTQQFALIVFLGKERGCFINNNI